MKKQSDNVAGQPVDASGPAVVKNPGGPSTTPIVDENEVDNKRIETLIRLYDFIIAWAAEIQKEKELTPCTQSN